jgi:hypothetical protein
MFSPAEDDSLKEVAYKSRIIHLFLVKGGLFFIVKKVCPERSYLTAYSPRKSKINSIGMLPLLFVPLCYHLFKKRLEKDPKKTYPPALCIGETGLSFSIFL